MLYAISGLADNRSGDPKSVKSRTFYRACWFDDISGGPEICMMLSSRCRYFLRKGSAICDFGLSRDQIGRPEISQKWYNLSSVLVRPHVGGPEIGTMLSNRCQYPQRRAVLCAISGWPEGKSGANPTPVSCVERPLGALRWVKNNEKSNQT